jgi:endonuclease G
MVPSADRTASPADNEATFILTNIVPQAPANNQGPWADLENDIRDLIRDGDEAYIIAGPQGAIDTLADGALTVPAAVWKIVVALPAGDNDLARISAQTRLIAVLMPNDDSVEGQRWQDYTTSVACIEALTDLDLLAALQDSVEAALAGESCPAEAQPASPAGAAQGVSIETIDYNPPGDDLAGEHVLLQNTGGRAASLAGWTLEDEAGATFTFPAFTLAPAAEVRVWVQAGADDASNLYWSRTQPVWNNGGDTAILRDANGLEVARFAYP